PVTPRMSSPGNIGPWAYPRPMAGPKTRMGVPKPRPAAVRSVARPPKSTALPIAAVPSDQPSASAGDVRLGAGGLPSHRSACASAAGSARTRSASVRRMVLEATAQPVRAAGGGIGQPGRLGARLRCQQKQQDAGGCCGAHAAHERKCGAIGHACTFRALALAQRDTTVARGSDLAEAVAELEELEELEEPSHLGHHVAVP